MSNNPVDLKGSVVLVVDDTPTNSALLQAILVAEGYRVEVVTSGEQALEQAPELQPDVILLDVVMPGIDGFETCRLLKEAEVTQETPVVFVTGQTKIKDVVEGFRAGAVDYITKPIQREEVCARVRTHLQSRVLFLKLQQHAEALETSNEKLSNEILQRQQAEDDLRTAKEIAQAAVHNIGNVITSINISTQFMLKTLNESKLPSFLKATEILTNQEDLAYFLTEDPKGKLVPEFFCSLAKYFERQHEQLTTETRSIVEQIELIKEVSAAQHSFVKNDGIIDDIPLLDIMDDVIKILLSFGHGKFVKIQKSYQVKTPIMVPKREIAHILMNLVKNAKESLLHKPPDNRKLTLDIHENENDTFTIIVQDNGGGISSENLKKLFNFGFTTKKTGHGFGLNYCAKVIQDMGGSIKVDSEGEGKGAAFTILLPCKIKKKASQPPSVDQQASASPAEKGLDRPATSS